MNVAGKGGAVLRQVRIEKTNASEPLMTCRKTLTDVETGIETLSWEESGWLPVYCFTGVRHEGGVILIQAWVRNVGTCRPDAKGDAPRGIKGVCYDLPAALQDRYVARLRASSFPRSIFPNPVRGRAERNSTTLGAL